MRRLAWLLALPYVVRMSSFPCPSRTYEIRLPECGKEIYHIEFKGKGWSGCDPKETCEDFAAALNEAHERRTEKLLVHREKEPAFEEQYLHWKESKKAEWLNATPVPCKEGSKEKNCVGFDYKKACEGSCSEDK